MSYKTVTVSTFSSEDILKAFRNAGISSGDLVFIHSSMKAVGRIEDGLQIFVQKLLELLGQEGTLVMPTNHAPHCVIHEVCRGYICVWETRRD